MSGTASREKWINNDAAFLQGIGLQIAEDHALRCLTSEDKAALATVSESVASWERSSSLDVPSADYRTGNHSHDQSGQAEEIDAITALFRSRYLVYENSIYADLFTETSEPTSVLVSPYAIYKRASAIDEQNARAAQLANNRVRQEEEYDDDDEEEEDGEEDEETTKEAVPRGASVSSRAPNPDHARADRNSRTPNGVRHGDRSGRQSQKTDTAIEDRKNENTILKFEIDSYYHTLEYDRHALLEQNTLEASDRQVEEESDSPEKEKTSAVNFGAANLSLKHLISKIDQSRERLAMSDNELRSLLSEVRKNRSKWANEDKVGQEELYEAAERVVLELRGYTEHSTAFLNKVTKRDVPDYYNIIKVPMDLGTLMKNLKNIQYKSKAEFARDVMLIWDNCLTYNADAAHPLRKHAFAMRRKSEQLLAMVPDVVVRDRAEVEAEEFGLDADPEDEDDEDEKPLMAGKSSRGTFGPKSVKAKKSKSTTKTGPAGADTNGTHTNGKVEDSDSKGSQSPERLSQAQKTVPQNAEDGQRLSERPDGQRPQEIEVAEETDAAFQVWRTRTKKTRARYAGARQKRIKTEEIRPDEPALQNTPFTLVSIGPDSASARKSEIPDLEGAGPHASETLEQSDELLLREYEVCSVPRLLTTADDEPASDNAFQVQDTLSYEPPIGGLVEKMRSTTLEMKSIRRLCTKLSTLKLMQDPTMSAFPASYFRQLMEADTPLKFHAVELNQAGFEVEPCGEVLARSLIQRSSAHVLYHAGFEDFQPQALDAFTEVAGEFMKTIGKVMKEYTESQQKLSTEEAVRHTLFEVGVEDLNALEDYVAEEIDSRSEKVVALHDRLKKFLGDFIQGNVDGDSGDKNLFDENNRDAFVSGSFGEETGEDFFGFRELGLDKEFGMSSLSVPLRLLQGRLRPTNGHNTAGDGDGVSPSVRFDRRFPHITKQVAARQIALFRPFLDAKFALLSPHDGGEGVGESSGGGGSGSAAAGSAPYLTEDEDLPMRQKRPKPRLGPTGKISESFKPYFPFK